MPRKPRTRKDMIEYLSNHFRYHTMNSWNRSTSYAVCVKVDLFVPHDLLSDAYDMLYVDSAYWNGRDIIREFEERHEYAWQIGSNGRSNGYLVLYSGGQKASGYKSYCTSCGQKNYTRVITDEMLNDKSARGELVRFFINHPIWTVETYQASRDVLSMGLNAGEIYEIISGVRKDFKENGKIRGVNCGVCPGKRVNYAKTHMQTYTHPGRGVDDDDPDFESWDTSDLRSRVDIVWEFDQTVEKIKKAFIDYVSAHRAVEKEIMVPKTVTVAVRREA